MQCHRKQCLMDIQTETQPQSRINYCINKGPLTVFDDQLPVGGKWENVEFLFPPIPIKPFHSHIHFRETSLAIPIPMGFPWESHGIPWVPWEFPYYAQL